MHKVVKMAIYKNAADLMRLNFKIKFNNSAMLFFADQGEEHIQ